MVNKILTVVLFFVAFSLQNQNLYAQAQKPKKLEIDALIIDYIEINQIKTGKKVSKPKRLNKIQTQNFVKNWNNKNKTIDCPAKFTYIVSVYFKDLTKKDYFLQNSIISDSKVYCIDTGIAGLAEAFWKAK